MASGDAMNSYGVYEVDIWIKERKLTHPVNMIEELNNNIISINLSEMIFLRMLKH